MLSFTRNFAAVIAIAMVALLSAAELRADTIPATFTGSGVSAYTQLNISDFRNLDDASQNFVSQFNVQIFDLGTQIGFRFVNTGAIDAGAFIGEIFFYDGHLVKNGEFLGPQTTVTSMKKTVTRNAFPSEDTTPLKADDIAPSNLPGFDPSIKSLSLTRFYAADSQGGIGVPAGSYADFRFTLLKTGDTSADGKIITHNVTIADVLHDLTSSLNPGTDTAFYIGLHIKNIDSDINAQGSNSYLTSPGTPSAAPVPLPGVALAGAMLMSGRLFRRRSARACV
jgi:hypothetical protein